MALQMCLQLRFLGETRLTHSAAVVEPLQVRLKRVFVSIAFVADVADKRLLSCMQPEVNRQATIVSEAFLTERAEDAFLFSCVLHAVLREARAVLEPQATI